MEQLDSENELLGQPWKAQPDDLIGGWCVTLMTEARSPSQGACAIASFVDKETAVHVAAIHNLWLQGAIAIV